MNGPSNYLQFAYSAFVGSFEGKLNLFYVHNTIVGRVAKTIRRGSHFKFISAITSGYLCSDNHHILLSLPERFGRLAIPLFHQYQNYSVNKMIKHNKHRRSM